MKIAFHGRNARAFRPGFDALLGQGAQGEGCEIVELGDALETEAERAHYASAEVIIGFRLDESLPRPEKLRLFHLPGAGYDRVDLSRLPEGAAACNCFGHEQAIAEYVMGALLTWRTPIQDADRRLRQGEWERYWAGSRGALRAELGAGTMGLLGFGRIGKAVAERAKAFGMTVSVANRSPVALSTLVDHAHLLSDLHAFMGSADAIVCSLPLTEETRAIVDAAALSAMKPDAVIVNVGRGPVIEEQALYDTLHEKRIGGAVIDTWYVYPSADAPHPQPSSLPFRELDNVVMTPHMSGWTHGTIERRQKVMADNIAHLVAGQALTNRIDG